MPSWMVQSLMLCREWLEYKSLFKHGSTWNYRSVWWLTFQRNGMQLKPIDQQLERQRNRTPLRGHPRSLPKMANHPVPIHHHLWYGPTASGCGFVFSHNLYKKDIFRFEIFLLRYYVQFRSDSTHHNSNMSNPQSDDYHPCSLQILLSNLISSFASYAKWRSYLCSMLKPSNWYHVSSICWHWRNCSQAMSTPGLVTPMDSNG